MQGKDQSKPTLHITDQRMLQIMDYCIANKLKGTSTIKGWCEGVGVSHTNIFNIRKGMQQFSKDHMHRVCLIYNISADYLFGFTNQMMRTQKHLSPIDRIKEAVNELEIKKQLELKTKSKVKKKVASIPAHLNAHNEEMVNKHYAVNQGKRKNEIIKRSPNALAISEAVEPIAEGVDW